MRPLTTAQLLDVWEQGRTRSPVEQGVGLLAAALPDTPPAQIARLSIGRRDALLLTLREWTFGPDLACVAACPACGERLEFLFQVEDILLPQPEEPEPLTLQADGYDIEYRLPNSQDLAALAASESAARAQLLERCILSIRAGDEPAVAAELPPQILQALEEDMARHDPQADIQLALACPECDHHWQSPFDILTFFWAELEAWARHILDEVHILASAYGWPEADILALSEARRRHYLERVLA